MSKMKLNKCLHWFGSCGTRESCPYKRNGECKKDGMIEPRKTFLDKLDDVGKIRVRYKYNGIRDLNN